MDVFSVKGQYKLDDETERRVDELARGYPEEFYNNKHVVRVAIIRLYKSMTGEKK